jgi:hypothetical protein
MGDKGRKNTKKPKQDKATAKGTAAPAPETKKK